MHEPAAHPKAFGDRPAGGADLVRQVLDDIKQGVVLAVDDLHDRGGRDVAGFKQRLSPAVQDGVITDGLPGDKFLHDIGDVRPLGGQEGPEAVFVAELMRVGSADAVVRLDDHRPADFPDKGHAAIKIVHDVPAGHGNPGLLVIFLHPALKADAVQVARLPAGGNVEIRPQHGVVGEPVLVVALQPVDPPVAVDEIGDRPVHLVIVFQGADLVILRQALPQLRLQAFIGAVADAQHPQAVLCQLPAEHPVVGGKIRRHKNKVLHGVSFLFRRGRLGDTSA